MKNHFYHIRWPPLNVTIFITHVRNLTNGSHGSYANAVPPVSLVLMPLDPVLLLTLYQLSHYNPQVCVHLYV